MLTTSPTPVRTLTFVLGLAGPLLAQSPATARHAGAYPTLQVGHRAANALTPAPWPAPPISPSATATIGCIATAPAFAGQPVPGGGTLAPSATFNPRTVNDQGAIAFFSQVSGASRNQGIFVADGQGLHAIVMGCGGLGGSGAPGSCGDPSPIGGTFAGLFAGTFFAPALNDDGDVLFLADVTGGSAPRGLFLYVAATQTIAKVAAVGDTSPLGGTFGAVGPGSLNDAEQVVFLASAVGSQNSDAFLWQNGTVTKVAAVGDAAPGGGTFQLIGTESLGFQDGTFVPGGPAPSINDQGQIAFRAIVNGGITSRGLVVDTGGMRQWYVKDGDVTPAGGTYFDFQAPILNERGEITFIADFRPTPSTSSTGWFAGAPGSWRKVLAFFDPVGAGICFGLAFSRNPLTPIDDFGNVIVWTDVKLPNTTMQEHLVVSAADGSLVVVAKAGDPTPLGGTYRSFESWPSLNDEHGAAFGATTPGAGGITDAHFVRPLCEVATIRSFAPGCTGSNGVPMLSSAPGQRPWINTTFTVQISGLPSGAAAMIVGGSKTSWAGLFPLPFDLTVVGMTGCSLAVSTDVVVPIAGTGPSRSWSLPLCNCASLVGGEFYQQVFVTDPMANPFGAVLSNAVEGSVGVR